MKLTISTVGGQTFIQEGSPEDVAHVKQAFKNFCNGQNNSGSLELLNGGVTHIIRWQHVVCVREE